MQYGPCFDLLQPLLMIFMTNGLTAECRCGIPHVLLQEQELALSQDQGLASDTPYFLLQLLEPVELSRLLCFTDEH